MGVGVTCPNCRNNFAFCCDTCKSYETEIYENFEPANYFQNRAIFYLKCRKCRFEYDHVPCPVCQTRIIPEKPFVTGDRGRGSAKRCFIATACLDSNSLILRELYVFRDELLGKSRLGRQCVLYYYTYSPGLARLMERHRVLRSFFRYVLVYPAYYTARAVMMVDALAKSIAGSHRNP